MYFIVSCNLLFFRALPVEKPVILSAQFYMHLGISFLLVSISPSD